MIDDEKTVIESDGEKVWSMTFTDVQDGYLDKYEVQLKGKGFETTIIKSGERGFGNRGDQ